MSEEAKKYLKSDSSAFAYSLLLWAAKDILDENGHISQDDCDNIKTNYSAKKNQKKLIECNTRLLVPYDFFIETHNEIKKECVANNILLSNFYDYAVRKKYKLL